MQKVIAHRAAPFLFGIGIAVATFLAYQPAWHGGFIWDDDAYVTHNPLLTAPDGLRRIWFSLDSPSQYFPLVYTTFRIEHALWALNPTGYHLVNIALHVASALLLWRLLARLGIPGAALAAAIFALHPVHVESVAWITERKNVLMGVFFLLTLHCWTRFVAIDSGGRWRLYGAALVFYALALFSKTTACTLPAALLLILWLKRMPITRARLLQVVPFLTMGLAMGAISVWWERYHQGTRGAFFGLAPMERLLVASRAIWFYLGKLIWPAKLTFIYPRWEIHAIDPLAYGWVVASLAAVFLIWRLRRRAGRGPEAAGVFFVATLSPLLGLIMLYTFRYTFVADHYQYLASIGPIALAAAGLTQIGERGRAWSVVGASVAVTIVAALAVLTWRQAHIYSNIEALWRTTIARSPGSWMAHNNLGIELAQLGRTDEAIAEYRQTIALAPKFPEAHYNAANALLSRGDATDALEEAKTALSLNANDADAHTSLGNALLATGRRTEARIEYESADKLRPGDPDANLNLALLLLQEGRTEQAVSRIDEVLKQRDDPRTHISVGNALLAAHRTADAIAQFTRALQLAPHDVIAQCNLALALATASDPTLRDGSRALALAQEANRASGGGDPVVLRSLAAAYAETGDFASAIRSAQFALDHATANGQADLADALRQEIELYSRGSAYRE
ncbi:MAG: tetratricopeptide repeat protein [Chthoniobacterales bacterium]